MQLLTAHQHLNLLFALLYRFLKFSNFFSAAKSKAKEEMVYNGLNIIYSTSNPCSDTLLTFYFPEAILHNFVLKFHTHPVEYYQLPMKVKTYSSYEKNIKRTTISLIVRGHRTQGLN